MNELERNLAQTNARGFSTALQIMMGQTDTEVPYSWRGLMKETVILYDFADSLPNAETN